MITGPFTTETALGPLAVTVTHDTVQRIELNRRGDRDAETTAERRVARELREYAEGRRRDFTFAIHLEGTPFDRRVWGALLEIPYGGTATYGEIAHKIGAPRAARAVGLANHRNPIPIVVPCHRVVAAGGKLGGYGGGLDLKRKLLDVEARGRPVMVAVRA